MGFYTQQQTEAVTREVFGVDSQLIEDATYLLIEADGVIVACGGWGRRSTSFGGDQAKSAPERLPDLVLGQGVRVPVARMRRAV